MASVTPVNNPQVSFAIWQGAMLRPQLRGGTDQRIGSGTVLAYTTNSRADISRIVVSYLAADITEATLIETAIQNFQNRVCEVVDAHGEVFPTVWCHKSTLGTKKLGASATGKTYLVQATLELEVLTDQIAQNTIPGN